MQALDRDRLGHQHPARGPEGDLPLQPGELVVLHLHRGHPEERGDDGEVDRAVAERQLRPLLPDQPRQPRRAPASARTLPRREAPPCSPTDGVAASPAGRGCPRLPVLAGGDEDLVAPRLEPLDDRAQDERMRGGGAIDPDPHLLQDNLTRHRFCYSSTGWVFSSQA